MGADQRPLSDELIEWLGGDGDKTLGALVDTFGDKSFALLFIVLLAFPALPLPTGGLSHVFEIITMLVALELIAGRREVWLPARWRRLSLTGDRQQAFVSKLAKLVARLERVSKPRLRFLLHHRFGDRVFGAFVFVCAAAAFVAPPFSGLDTLPSLAGVVGSVGMALEDFAIVAGAAVVLIAGVTLEIALGTAAYKGISSII